MDAEIEKLIEVREKYDWESIIVSAIGNPQPAIGNFMELKDKAIKEGKYFSEKVVFETNNYKTIFKIGWDKSKFFFKFEHVMIDKRISLRVGGVDEAHGIRHLHSDNFITPNPDTLLEKIEHPILSSIINSETEERKAKWINKLANELKDSQINWVRYIFSKK